MKKKRTHPYKEANEAFLADETKVGPRAGKVGPQNGQGGASCGQGGAPDWARSKTIPTTLPT